MSSVVADVMMTIMMIDNCSWDNPGNNPYMGSIPAAVDHYTEIPATDRAAIKLAMENKQYTDIVLITKSAILGAQDYSPEITNMHFGNGDICKSIARTKWDSRIERGLVFCSGDYCVMVPTVCRNVSIIHKLPPQKRPEPEPIHKVPEPTIFPLMLILALLITKLKWPIFKTSY